MATLAVIGGGISGLSTVHYLTKFAPYAAEISKVVLLESSNRLGGWIKSTKLEKDSAIFEQGPHTIRGYGAAAYNTLDLIEDLGLDNELLPVGSSNPAINRRLIYVDYEESYGTQRVLSKLPSTVSEFFRPAYPFNIPFVIQGIMEVLKRRQTHEDESIHNFIQRRFTKEIADFVVDPMCRGIFAGSSKDLSLKSCFKVLHDAERDHGSIIIGMLRNKGVKPEGNISKLFKENKWSVWSMEQGLEQLVKGLEDHILDDGRVHIYKEKPCTRIEFSSDKTKVYTKEDVFEVDHVIGACYSKALGYCLQKEQNDLKNMLFKIPAATVAVANMEFDGDRIPLTAFGHLVPSSINPTVLGYIYASKLFEEHNNRSKKTCRLTAMMGGSWYDSSLFGDPDNPDKAKILDIAVTNAVEQWAIAEFLQPINSIVNVHKECIPQYIIGHSKNLEAMMDYIESNHLPLTLTGASYRGAAVNDVILDARLQAEKIVNKLKS